MEGNLLSQQEKRLAPESGHGQKRARFLEPDTTAQVSTQNKKQKTHARDIYPVPGRYGLSYMPSSDPPSEWFLGEFAKLYYNVTEFVEAFFCQSDLPHIGNGPSLWINRIPLEFQNFAEMVADPEPSSGGWNRMLSDRIERRYLLVGILARILEAKVFNELLFGAEDMQKANLESLERTFAGEEGM